MGTKFSVMESASRRHGKRRRGTNSGGVVEGLRALERSPVSHKCSTLIRVIHFIIRLLVLALSNMQHADSTEEDIKAWRKIMKMNGGAKRWKGEQGVQRGFTLTTTFSVYEKLKETSTNVTQGHLSTTLHFLSQRIPNCAIYHK